MKSEIPVYDISTISGFKRKDILVSRLGLYAKRHLNLRYAHRHNFYHLVLFTQGSGNHSIDFLNYRVKAYQIYFMIPGQVHSWDFDEDIDGYVVNFSGSFFQSFLLRSNYLEDFSFFHGAVKDSVIDVPDECRIEIKDHFEDILKEGNDSKQFSADFIRLLLLKIFILISRFTEGKKENLTTSYNYTLLKNFQQLIEKNFTNLRLPKEYAELLYITPNHLNALCNDLLGVSAGEVIRNRISLEAKRLLINMELSISEIAYQLNFSDNSYFTKFFKKQAGVTPDEFRKKTLNKYKNEKSES